MKRLLNKIMDTLADATLLEIGVDVQIAVAHRFNPASGPLMSPLKRLFINVEETLVDVALLEEGVDIVPPCRRTRLDAETLEENLIEVVFAEADDFNNIHEAIVREHQFERNIASTAITTSVSFNGIYVHQMSPNS